MHQHSDRHNAEDDLIGGGILVLAGVNAHRHNGSLDGLDRVIGLFLPPFLDFLELLSQRILLMLREFQIFQPSFVLSFRQRVRLVGYKPRVD